MSTRDPSTVCWVALRNACETSLTSIVSVVDSGARAKNIRMVAARGLELDLCR